jgi:hypothetical protein
MTRERPAPARAPDCEISAAPAARKPPPLTLKYSKIMILRDVRARAPRARTAQKRTAR